MCAIECEHKNDVKNGLNEQTLESMQPEHHSRR